MNITEEEVERAVHYLATSAKDYAYWKGEVSSTEYLIKIAEAKAFLEVESGTQEQKKSLARSSKEYQEAVDNYAEAVVHYTKFQSYRKAAEIKISVYQSNVKAHSQGLNL